MAGEKVGDEVRAHLGNGVRLHERDAFEPYLARAGRQDDRGRSRAVGGGDHAGARGGGGDDRRCARPGGAGQGDQESGRDRRAQGGAGARRGGDREFLRWIEEDDASGEIDEIERRGALEALREETGGAQGSVVQHHSAVGPNGALPHYGGTGQPAAGRGHAVSVRFGRAISGRDDRYHAHGAARRADRRDARPLHAGAQGAYRDCHGAVPEGHARQPARQLRAAAVCGKRAAIMPMAPGMASAPSCRSTRGRSGFRRSGRASRAATSRCARG